MVREPAPSWASLDSDYITIPITNTGHGRLTLPTSTHQKLLLINVGKRVISRLFTIHHEANEWFASDYRSLRSSSGV